MRLPVMVGSLAIVSACGSSAPKPPAEPAAVGIPGTGLQVLHYAIIINGRHAGDDELRIEVDGKRLEHYAYNDRGRGPDLRSELQFDEHGLPRSYRATGVDYKKLPIDERLDEDSGTLRWQSASEHGAAPVGRAYYLPVDGGGATEAELAQALIRAPGHRLALLPAGEAWIEDDTTRDFSIGGTNRRLRRIAIAGAGLSPHLVWLDEDAEVFGWVSSWSSMVRSGAEAAIPVLLADDQAWQAARAGKLAQSLPEHPPGGKLAFVHARLFDSERKVVTPDATVVIDGDRITAVGGAATPVPAGARVIDAHGRTLLPGLWDMHVHLSRMTGMLGLASGVTTVRDLGNDMDELTARVARFDAGTEIGPRVLRAGLIDGSGKFAAPIGVLADTPEQATAAVARYADAGYVQIKLYSSLPPSLVPIIARDTHARGLRLSGHIPNGMNAAQAVEAGYDEIQHVNFLFLRFLAQPGDDTRTPVRFTRVGDGAAKLDLASPEVQHFFDLLVAHHTVIDPTLAIFHGQFTTDPGQVDPIYIPYADRLPPQVVRDVRSGGWPAPGAKRAQYRDAYAAMLRMVKLAWDKKVTIVAGTDIPTGLALPHELELYVQAGIPPADVLAIATLGAARVMGKDRESGSIAVGKRADLVLVDGDPTRDISTVRNTDAVVCRGVVYDPAKLFAAAGIRAR